VSFLLVSLNNFSVQIIRSGIDYGGGGFSVSGDGGPSPSQGGFGGGGGGRSSSRKSYDEQTIQPVTISMCFSSSSDDDGTGELLEDGRKLHHVKIVGAVRNIEDFSTNCLYNIEDGTGLIEVKQWIDTNDCSALQEIREACLKDGTYLSIVGQIKDYDGKKTIVADSVRPVSTGNELTHHMLEVVYAAENHKRMNSSAYGANMLMKHHGGKGFGVMQTGSPIQQYVSHSGVNDSLRDAVLTFIRKEGDGSDTGASVPLCIQMLQGRYSEYDIRKVIEDLAAEGHIYSTIDENHYKFAM
jgi:replication factor A2